jgi:RNA-dependent RNA polymerase
MFRTNRVIRKYLSHAQNFVRVSFLDEDRLQYRQDREVKTEIFIQDRVRPFLKDGIDVAGAHLEFVAYSQSALKEATAWFLRPFADENGMEINAAYIIASLGDFHNVPYDAEMRFCPARYGARISQAFSATDSSVRLKEDNIHRIDDIKRNNHNFTDGVGTLSRDVAISICESLYHKRRSRRKPLAQPTTFQIRLMVSDATITC